jgi:hypothetical protein
MPNLLTSLTFCITTGILIVSLYRQYGNVRKTKRYDTTLLLHTFFSGVLLILSVLISTFGSILDMATAQTFLLILSVALTIHQVG